MCSAVRSCRHVDSRGLAVGQNPWTFVVPDTRVCGKFAVSAVVPAAIAVTVPFCEPVLVTFAIAVFAIVHVGDLDGDVLHPSCPRTIPVAAIC